MTRTPIDWTFDGHPIYPPECDLPLPRYQFEKTTMKARPMLLAQGVGYVECKAHALGSHSAAISTPPERPNCQPMLVIFSHGLSVSVFGVEALEALGEAIQHALGVSND